MCLQPPPPMSSFSLNLFVKYDCCTKKLYIFHVNLMSLEISIHLWNPHHNLWPHKPIHHFQNVLLPLSYDADHNENTDKIFLPRNTLGLQYSIVNSRLLDLQDVTRLVQLPRHLDGAPSYMASWVTATVGMPTETPTVLAVCAWGSFPGWSLL